MFSRIRSLPSKLPTLQLPERLKGTVVEKWAQYWKVLGMDYKDVGMSVVKNMRDHPAKTLVYSSIAGATYYCIKNNPDEKSYIEQQKKWNAEVLLVDPLVQNPRSAEYLKFLERCHNEGIVRHLDLGVVSFIWLDNFDKATAVYKATCSYLKPDLLTFHERIIDVGFLNRYHNLDKMMIDYDVNF